MLDIWGNQSFEVCIVDIAVLRCEHVSGELDLLLGVLVALVCPSPQAVVGPDEADGEHHEDDGNENKVSDVMVEDQ